MADAAVKNLDPDALVGHGLSLYEQRLVTAASFLNTPRSLLVRLRRFVKLL